MPRVNDQKTILRREQVLTLWTKGASLACIARDLRVDRQTVRRDVAYLGAQAAGELDAGHELARCLLSAKEAEADAWGHGQAMRVLAAIRVQVGILQLVQGAELERRLVELETRLDDAQQVSPWATPRIRAEARRN